MPEPQQVVLPGIPIYHPEGLGPDLTDIIIVGYKVCGCPVAFARNQEPKFKSKDDESGNEARESLTDGVKGMIEHGYTIGVVHQSGLKELIDQVCKHDSEYDQNKL